MGLIVTTGIASSAAVAGYSHAKGIDLGSIDGLAVHHALIFGPALGVAVLSAPFLYAKRSLIKYRSLEDKSSDNMSLDDKIWAQHPTRYFVKKTVDHNMDAWLAGGVGYTLGYMVGFFT